MVVSELPEATSTGIVELSDGETYELTASPVRKTLYGKELGLFAYNGQIPGPILKVRQHSTISIDFTNELELPTTVHWHGVRVDNRNDGVPDVTQDPVEPGESFTYEVKFPDQGVFWYHPHVREDVQQELGLYGNILVIPADQESIDVESFVVLDDLRLTEEGIEPFFDEPNYALMGRFGNEFFINGEEEYLLEAQTGERVRFYVTNVANTRVFNISLEGNVVHR